MRKLVSSTIVILPLLLLAILLVSGAIVSLLTHIYVEHVEFSNSEAIILVMEDEKDPPKYNLGDEITVLPLKATDQELLFDSDDESVATVSVSGEVSATSYGETYITVTSKENPAASAQRKVIVTDDSVHELRIVSETEIKQDMYEGETQKLNVVVLPKEAVNKSVTWSSSDSSILNVSDSGTITAIGSGKAKVIVTSDENPEIKAELEITCYPKIKGIQFDNTRVLTSSKLEKVPQVTVQPNDFGVKVTYSSDDENIASVDNSGNITFHSAGHVKITVKATDFGNNHVEKSKEYTSTYGYYTGPLFEPKTYTVDYYAYSNGTELPISLVSAPEGAYQLIKSVSYSTNGVLQFNEDTKKFKFIGQMPKGTTFVDVIVHATVYDEEDNNLKEDYTDSFRLNVTRNATEISTSYNGTETDKIQTSQRAITFSTGEGKSTSIINVKIGPENHTNKVVYQLLNSDGDVAAIDENGNLTFKKSGIVTVKILLKKADNTDGISKEVTISYTEPEQDEKQVVFDDSQETEKQVNLNMRDPDDKDTGIIYFSTPEGATVGYKVVDVAGQEKVIDLKEGENGNYTITPLRGGEATIEITVSYPSKVRTLALTGDGETKVYRITVYVDLPVTSSDFTIKLNDQEVGSIKTSLEKVNYSVTVNNDDGRMEGKELYVVYGDNEVKAETITNFAGIIEFATKNELEIRFEVRYKDEIKQKYYSSTEGEGLCVVTRRISTTHGNLDSFPTVTYAGGKIETNQENRLTFNNLNEQIVLTIGNNFDPADFRLEEHLPQMQSTQNVKVEISSNTITLTSLLSCKNQNMTLTIGGQTVNIIVDVISVSDTISISYNGTQLSDQDDYTTILNELTFNVAASRQDGKTIDNTKVKYSFDNLTWTEVDAGDVKIDLSELKGKIYLCSADEGASTQIKLRKETVEDFGLKLMGNSQIDLVESVKNKGEVSYYLPSSIQGKITLSIILDKESLLGGVGDESTFKSLFNVDLNTTGWSSSYNAISKEITVNFGGENAFTNKNITLICGDITLKITLSLVNVQSINFTGFDSAVYNDVYPGYQQARVFAKKSFYDSKEVDYFKMPYIAYTNTALKTEAAPEAIVWSLTRYVGNQPEVIATQHGRDVKIGQQSYKIVKLEDGSNVLQDLNGNTVSGQDGKNSGGYIWIDVFTEPNYARIYFGNFSGLTEIDIQNDYFGNFDDKETWTKPTQPVDDNSGRKFDITEGKSFSFLRVEASDGARDGTNRHFNFNVLDDDTVVNVFDTAGYYANKKVVLHTDLYGGKVGLTENQTNKYTPNDDQDEVPQTDDNKDKFIRSYNTNDLNKDLIYGNGHSVCFNARNEQLRRDTNPSNLGNSGGVTFKNVYNVTIKGRNQTDKVNVLNHGVVFVFNYCFYSNIQHYYKVSPSGGKLAYFKNAVINKAIKGIQPYYTGATVYFENTVITDCMMAVCCEGTGTGEGHNFKIYFKGFNDILNYHSCDTLAEAMPNLGFLFPMVFPSAEGLEEYAEWFGKEVPSSNDLTSQRFINSIVFLRCAGSNTSADYEIKSWNGEEYVDSKDLALALDLAAILAAHGWTYNSKVDTDGGILNENNKPTDRDMSRLFSEERYIRLLCQYKDFKNGAFVRNDQHILWHMQSVYRDQSLLGNRVSHIEDLKDSLKGTTWADGSGVGSDGNPYEPGQMPTSIIALTKYLSCAIIPKKEVA